MLSLLPSRLDFTLARRLARVAIFMGPMMFLCGCSVLAVADAAVSVAATAVSVTATVVETTVDVAAAGVRAATADDKDENKEEDKADEGKAADQSDATQRSWQPPEWPTNR